MNTETLETDNSAVCQYNIAPDLSHGQQLTGIVLCNHALECFLQHKLLCEQMLALLSYRHVLTVASRMLP